MARRSKRPPSKTTLLSAERGEVSEIDVYYALAPVGVCLLDADLRYLRINERLAEINGLPVAAHLGRTVREILPQLATTLEPLMRRVFRTGRAITGFAVTGETAAQPGVERSWIAGWHPVKDAAGRTVAVACMAEEITERKRAEAERARLIETIESERRQLATVIEQMPAGLLIVDAKTSRVLLRNGAAFRILGDEIADTLSQERRSRLRIMRPDGVLMPEKEYPIWRATHQGAVITGAEVLIGKPDGSRISVRVNAAPIRDARGRIVAGAATFFDITAERAALEALRESEAKFRKIAENSPFGMGTHDAEGRINFMNPKLIEIVGWRPRDVPDLRTWFTKVYPDKKYRQEVEAAWAGDIARVQRGEIKHSPVREYRVACRDGTEKTCEITFALGQELTYAVFNDVTARKHAAEELRQATEFMHALLDSAPLTIYVRDAAHRYRLVNREWERVFRQKRAKVIGRAIDEVLPRDLAVYLESTNRRVLAKGRTISTEESIEFPNGRHIFHTVKFPLRNAAGRVDAVGGISIDMTERVRAEKEILRLNTELEQRVADRTAELAAANRELRREIAERQRLQSELLDISEREQRRLGQDLHDELGQQLTGLGILTAALERELRRDGHPRAAAVAELGGLLRRAVHATRNLAGGFYPVVLEQGGLLVALRDLASRTRAASGVKCTVLHRAAFRFGKPSAIHLYRIAQEAVNNAIKHGAARHIRIELTARRGVSILRVVSDGSPFRPPASSKRGYGLHIMQYRARLIGAEVTVGAGADAGCEVTCALGDKAGK